MADMNAMRLGISPLPFSNPTSTPAFTSFTIDASNDGIGIVFRAQEAATITHVGVRYALRAGTPVQHIIGLQGVDTTNGRPDGTYLGGGTPASGLFTPPADTTWDGTFQWVALDNSYTCTRGELLSIMLAPNGTTPDGSNNSAFTTTVSNVGHAWPFGRTRNTGSWNSTAFQTPVYGYKSSTKSYGSPFLNVTSASINSGTTPDEIGAGFTIPAGATSSYKATSMRALVGVGGSTTDATFRLYQNTTLLDTQDVDGSYRPGNTIGTPGTTWDDGDTLTAGTEYIASVQPSTANGMSLWYAEYNDAQDAKSCPGGDLVKYYSRTDAGAWSETTTRRLFIELFLEDMSARALLTGGMQA